MKFLSIAAYILMCSASQTASTGNLIEPISKDNSPQCQCYLVSGPDLGYFQYHRFWDFRNIPNDGINHYTAAPPLVTNLMDGGEEPVTSSYFNTSTFLADWDIQTGVEERNSQTPTYNSAQNVYISRNSSDNASSSTFLTLRAYRPASFVSIAEIDSNQKNLLHSSIRVCARILPNGLTNASAPSASRASVINATAGSNTSHPVDVGAVWGFFTYHSDDQESDIEVLTRDDTSQIHYSNQPDFNYKTNDPVPGASTQVTLPRNQVWTEWNNHRIDWFSGIARWYLNGKLLQNKSKNAQTDHGGLIVNLWSDGGEWSGNMSIGSQVTVGIEWIEMVFNVSGNVDGTGNHRRSETRGFWKRKEMHCEIGCNVDGVKVIGVPEVAYNVSSSASSVSSQGTAGSGVCSAAILTVLFLLLA